jgi:hypothetical protein
LKTSALNQIGGLDLAPGAVANMKYLDLFLLFEDAEYYAINARLSAVEQLPQLLFLRIRGQRFGRCSKVKMAPSTTFEPHPNMPH